MSVEKYTKPTPQPKLNGAMGVIHDTTLVDIFTAIFYIKTALLNLEYPLDYDIVSGVSFYADGMDDRTDDPSADTLGQSYINYATFIDDNQNATNCLDI